MQIALAQCLKISQKGIISILAFPPIFVHKIKLCGKTVWPKVINATFSVIFKHRALVQKKRRSKLFSFCNYANLDMENEKFSIFAPFRIGKTGAKILSFEESLFGIRAYLRYFQIVMRTQTSDLRTKSGRSSLFPLQGHSVLPKGSEMSPDSEKDDLWIRWSVLSFRMRNAPRKLRVIYCFYLQSIWKAFKMIKIFAPKIITQIRQNDFLS